MKMQTEISTDYRVRIGREKRDRMRKRLLAAVMECFAEREDHATPKVDDVMRVADVSRATFYLYFVSMEDAFNSLLGELDRDIGIVEHFFERSDPLARLATGTLIFLFRSVADSVWAKFVSRTSYLSENVASVEATERHLIAAKEAKLLHFKEVAAARSLLVGSMSEAMRFLSKENDRSRPYVEELTVMILSGLGADHQRCIDIVRDRAIYIRGYAPDCLPWWKDPWVVRLSDRKA